MPLSAWRLTSTWALLTSPRGTAVTPGEVKEYFALTALLCIALQFIRLFAIFSLSPILCAEADAPCPALLS